MKLAIAPVRIKVNKLDYIFKKFNNLIIAIFVLVIALSAITFFSRLYQLDKENDAALAEQAASLKSHEGTDTLIETITDNMFRDVLQTSSIEGLAFMELYAVAIEDDVVNQDEFGLLTSQYELFTTARSNGTDKQVTLEATKDAVLLNVKH